METPSCRHVLHTPFSSLLFSPSRLPPPPFPFLSHRYFQTLPDLRGGGTNEEKGGERKKELSLCLAPAPHSLIPLHSGQCFSGEPLPFLPCPFYNLLFGPTKPHLSNSPPPCPLLLLRVSDSFYLNSKPKKRKKKKKKKKKKKTLFLLKYKKPETRNKITTFQ